MKEPLFLGIDGGGTHCRARIDDASGRTLGEGLAGSANTRLGLAHVFEEIQTACRQALQAAGLSDCAMARLHASLGLAGLALQSERAKLGDYPHPFASLVAENDAYMACLGAHRGEDGAILILGTGSCGCGIVAGRSYTIGGWGFTLADRASGAALGRAALRQAVWAYDEVIPATPMSRAVMARFGNAPERAVLWSDQAKPRDFAALAPLVFEHAERGDVLARALLEQAAREAAQLIRALRRRQGASARVSLLGGVAEPLSAYLPPGVRASLSEPLGDALDGALLMARRRYSLRTPRAAI